MGMFYAPRRSGLEGYQLTWNAHAFVGRTLEGLGAEMGCWSGDDSRNVYVPVEVCQGWAGSLRAGIEAERIRIALAQRAGGKNRAVPVVDGSAGRAGSLAQALETIDVQLLGSDRVTDSTPTVPLDPDHRALLDHFATFLERCGGCWQR